MFNLYKCDEKPSNRLRFSKVFRDPKFEYVEPIFPKQGKNHTLLYGHNGFAFENLEPGSYFFMVCFLGFEDQRKYMIRVVGDDLKLEILK